MLFAGLGSVRMVKNCDLRHENAALGLRLRAAFSSPCSQFFIIQTSQPANNIYVFQQIIIQNCHEFALGYTWTALLSANQNQVIFSCMLLLMWLHGYTTDTNHLNLKAALSLDKLSSGVSPKTGSKPWIILCAANMWMFCNTCPPALDDDCITPQITSNTLIYKKNQIFLLLLAHLLYNLVLQR